MKVRPPGTAERQFGSPSREQADRSPRPQNNKSPTKRSLGWYSRGYLPHFDASGIFQMITYRLADSLPGHVLVRMKRDMEQLPENKRGRALRERIESWMDAGHGSCILRRPEAARCVVENWRHFHGSRYWLVAGVVMPNHVHVLIQMGDEAPLGRIVKSWKSYRFAHI